MEREGQDCPVCWAEESLFKQGESIIVEFRMTDDEGIPLTNIRDYRIVVLLMTTRACAFAYGHNAGPDMLPVEVDEDGCVAIEVDATQTADMLGKYYIEMSVGRENTQVITQTVPAFEIIRSQIGNFIG